MVLTAGWLRAAASGTRLGTGDRGRSCWQPPLPHQTASSRSCSAGSVTAGRSGWVEAGSLSSPALWAVRLPSGPFCGGPQCRVQCELQLFLPSLWINICVEAAQLTQLGWVWGRALWRRVAGSLHRVPVKPRCQPCDCTCEAAPVPSVVLCPEYSLPSCYKG